MKIKIGFRDSPFCTAETIGDTISWEGENTQGVRSIADFYSRKYDVKGDDLLKLLASRLKGNTWASIVKE